MKVEIWSDLLCPFCYIGKRKFEIALEQFSFKSSVQIVWRSYKLDLEPIEGLNYVETLSSHKGWSKKQTLDATTHVTELGKSVGLDFHFEKGIITKTTDAHRLSHLAKKHEKQNEIEELLFKAHFTEGKNISDPKVLQDVGLEVGLPENEVIDLLNSDLYLEEVSKDIKEAKKFGIAGVPYFLVNGKLVISGAQDPSAFLKILKKGYEEKI